MLLVAWPAVAQTSGESRILPPGRIFEVAIEKGVDSSKSKPGDPISAVLLHPLVEQGRVVAPVGSRLTGVVVAAHRLGLGLMRGSAMLSLRFDRLAIDGVRHAIELQVASVDTGRERVDASGRIFGVSPVISASGALSSYALRAAIITSTPSRTAMLTRVFITPVPDHEIRLPAGTTLMLRTTAPAELPAVPMTPAGHSREDLSRIVAATLRSVGSVQVRSRSGHPTDQLNLAFVGSADDLESAFRAAGWSGSRRRNAESIFHCARALLGRRGFSDAPMAPMVFNQSAPDFEFQKGLNTFSKRHHLRIWRIGTAGGQELWVAAATEDVKVSFSFRRLRWHHDIHPDTTTERTKVVSDLSFTGCTQSTSMMPVPLDSRDRQGDGRIAVVELGSCVAPRRLPQPEPVRLSGNRVTRYLTRVGSDLWRENPFVVGVAAFHMPVRSLSLRGDAALEARSEWARQQAWMTGPESQAFSLVAYTELGPAYPAAGTPTPPAESSAPRPAAQADSLAPEANQEK